MHPKMKTALEQSIEMWEDRAKGVERDDKCPLCKASIELSAVKVIECEYCPVMCHTGEDGCDGSPYFNWLNAYKNYGHDNERTMRAAQVEVDFLKSLREENHG